MSNIWQTFTIISTYELRNNAELQDKLFSKYRYVSQIHKPYLDVIRNPTSGCFVVLYKNYVYDSVPIFSKKGQKLLTKHCYF